VTAYYNEIDPQCAASLRELIRGGIIAPGDVDERSIEDVRPADLAGYVQCHFFAGGGVWSYALRCAGWPDDRPVWTGSCPCQPFSSAGKGAGFADERHLWPSFFHLARVRRPVALFGEQVSSKDGLAWFDHVRSDLEGEGYPVGVSDTCAAGFGAPHLRQRLYFVADASNSHGRPGERGAETRTRPDQERRRGSASGGAVGAVADSESLRGREGFKDDAGSGERGREEQGAVLVGNGNPDFLVHTLQPGLEGHAGDEQNGNEPGRQRKDEARPIAKAGGVGFVDDSKSAGQLRTVELEDGGEGADRRGATDPCAPSAGATNGFWSNVAWIPCRDGKWRPTEPGTFPLAHGAAARVGRLRMYGNCIVAPQVEAFVRAYMEVMA